MRKAVLSSISALGMSAGLAWAQPCPPVAPNGPPPYPPGVVGMPAPAGPAGPAGPATPPCASDCQPPPIESNTKGAFDGPDADCEKSCWYATGEYLHWWIHKNLPPLVTESGSNGTGILGQPGTTPILGGVKEDDEQHSGGRFFLGYNLCDLPVTLEGGFMFLGERATKFDIVSNPDGSPVLARPVIDATTGTESALYISAPGQFIGAVEAQASSRLYSGEANIIFQLMPCSWLKHPDVLVGVRYLDLKESITISATSEILDNGIVGSDGTFFGAGTLVNVTDAFTTRNQFFGAQIGARTTYEWDSMNLFMNFSGNLAFGNTHQVISIDGGTTITPPGGTPTQLQGGLLAQATNIGRYSHDSFSVIPEGNFTFGWHAFPSLDIFLGWSCLYWTDVVRPDKNIDRVVNPTQLSSSFQSTTFNGINRPAFSLHESDVWMQGFHLGLAYKF